jgi:hypothetical protein
VPLGIVGEFANIINSSPYASARENNDGEQR